MGGGSERSDLWKGAPLLSVPRRSPWCPNEEDRRILAAALDPELARAGEQPVLLALGITPELLHMDWAPEVAIIAVDSSPAVITTWLDELVRPQILCAWWQQMPLTDASVDAALGDGSLNSLTSIDDYPLVLTQAARVLRPGGLMALRCFLRPARPETPEQLLRDAEDGRFPTLRSFGFQLALSIAGEDGVLPIRETPRRFAELVADGEDFAEAVGWERTDVPIMNVALNSPVRLTFPTLDRLQRLAAPHFAIEGLLSGHYDQAAHCPTMLLRRR